ncbi:MAG: hypothetical protein HYS23_01580 [Geobacter sp.]|nr:hypothetical protein [Geobacter sp.]
MAYMFKATDVFSKISFDRLKHSVAVVNVAGYGAKENIITQDHANGKPNRSHRASADAEFKAAKALLRGRKEKATSPFFGTRIREGYELIKFLLK